jgi:hypothetical protein
MHSKVKLIFKFQLKLIYKYIIQYKLSINLINQLISYKIGLG